MHDVSLALVELGAVVLCLGLLARIAHKIGLSPIPLYLIAGLAFGHGGFLPVDYSADFIQLGAEIGAILLLLLLGVEYSARELVTNLRSNSPAGLLDIAANFTPGFIAGLWLGWGPVTAVVLGGVTFVSSSGIIAKTLNDLGRMGNRETPTILSILVLEDLAMALYLPVVTGLLIGGSFSTTVRLVGVAIATVTLILFVALRWGSKLSKLIGRPNDEVLLLVVLGLALLVSGFADALNVSAGVGAFLVGIALSGPVAHGAAQLLSPLRDLFAAVFFVFFGLQTDPGAIVPVFWIALALAVVTALTKFATGYVAARRAGCESVARKRAGIALIARGEFSVVIAGLSVAAGGEAKLGALVAAYVMILAIAGPILSRFVGNSKAHKVSEPDLAPV